MKMKKMSMGTPVRVQWVDSQTLDGWQHPKQRIELLPINSLGLVVKSDKAALTMTTSIGDNNAALCPLSIPWSAVVRMKVLKRLE